MEFLVLVSNKYVIIIVQLPVLYFTDLGLRVPLREYRRLQYGLVTCKMRGAGCVEVSAYKVFSETCHKYSLCEWALLKRFARSEAKDEGHVYRCMNAIIAETCILMMWCRGLLVDHQY